MKVAILDDYQNVAFKTADWSAVASRAEIHVFNDHIADPATLVENLKLIASTGPRNANDATKY